MARSSVTIRDVAARAGVSHQTVSRVINGVERVNPETRRRVQEAIDALGYAPNAIARFMARGRTHLIACIAPNLTDFTFASLIEGAESEARRRGYFVITASAPCVDDFALLGEQLFSSRQAEGLIVINPYADERYKILPQGVPCVFLGARPRDNEADAVYLNEENAGRRAARHLLTLGHRRIFHITGPHSEDCTQDRLTGYTAELRSLDVNPQPEWIIEGDWSATSGYQAVERWLADGLDFTAVFAQNDRMAVGALRALRDAGKRVPEDVSVIGFDDIPLASYFDPPLTTIRQDIPYSGQQAARLLIRRIEAPESPHHTILAPAELVVRASTAPLKGGDA